MEELWSRGEGTVREVLEALNGRGGPQRANTTSPPVMRRRHAKEPLRRERSGRHDRYAPTLTRDAYAEARAGVQVGELVSEYGDVALAHFARHISGLDPARRDQIRRLAEGNDCPARAAPPRARARGAGDDRDGAGCGRRARRRPLPRPRARAAARARRPRRRR